MNTENLKCYVLPISTAFPKTHERAGEPTEFQEKIIEEIKRHTIRANYPYWYKRIQKVIAGEAYISVRKWTGKPYVSPQEELFKFTKEDGVGIQKIQITDKMIWIDGKRTNVSLCTLANNDGLSIQDFKEWFKKIPEHPMALIHFTGFRYQYK